MLELFANSNCSYCQKVIHKLNELEIDFIFRSHNFEKAENSWGFKIGGKTQVPLLVDMSKNLILYESDKIIEYLDSEFGRN